MSDDSGFGNLVKQAQQLQERLAKVQAEAAARTVEGSAGGGMVKATVNGRLEVVRVLDMPEQLSEHYEVRLAVEFGKPQQAAGQIARLAAEQPVAAILSVDDAATELAALSSELAGLPANDPNAARAARDKYVMRSQLAASGVKTPWFTLVPAENDPATVAMELAFPCVVKPRRLSAEWTTLASSTGSSRSITMVFAVLARMRAPCLSAGCGSPRPFPDIECLLEAECGRGGHRHDHADSRHDHEPAPSRGSRLR